MMSRSVNSDKSWNSTDEEYEDCDHSSPSNQIGRRISGEDIPGCITTHSVSSVIRPGCKTPRTDPLQFVKIKNNELCKKAVEQIKLAEEVKITKEKIKEVEEEWQNNLLSWKSKRRQSKNSSEDESGTSLASNRKTKTFSEILNEKAKSGQRIGYNLHKYLDGEIDNENELKFDARDAHNYETEYNDKNFEDSFNGDDERLDNNINSNNNNNIINSNDSNNERSNLGDVIVFDTSLLEEFSRTSNHKRQDSSEDSSIVDITGPLETFNDQKSHSKLDKNSIKTCDQNHRSVDSIKHENKYNSETLFDKNFANNDNCEQMLRPDRIDEIEDWKQDNNQQRDNVLLYLMKQEQQQQNHSQDFPDDDINLHNSSYDAEDDEEDDEEIERLRLEQEKSFKAKLSAFESLAKQEEYISSQNSRSNKPKPRDDSKRQPPAREELILSEHQQQVRERPVVGVYGAKYNDNEESEDVMNARIQQLHIERQKAQRPTPQNMNGQPTQPQQPLPPNVIYQSPNYNQNPVHSVQSQQRSQYDHQQYYMIDEPITKPNSTPVRSPQPIRPQPIAVQPQPNPNQFTHKQPIQPQEHLYVNQKQLFNQTPNPNQYYEPIESHQRYGPEYYGPGYEQKGHLSQQVLQPIPQSETGAQQSQHIQPTLKDVNYPPSHNQYLYYPKPYANKQTPIQKPVMSSTHKQIPNQRPAQQPTATKQVKPQPTTKPHSQSGYNQNHWLLQEAELRRQLATIPTQASLPSTVSATQRPTTTGSVNKSPTPQKGMLSVSGKKKCSSCGDELGRGCAAMVVESLSLYYHINCFRCSVCNIQLGNGTVGTDVRVRNHKLHCQNCYSNDEAGLKFSRV